LRSKRDRGAWQKAMDGLRQCCQEGGNLMPPVMEAVRARATLGEIQGVFRESFGLWDFPLR